MNPEEIGKKWIHPKTGEVRYYVNHADEYSTLYVTHYKSGNISYASLDDEKISNTKAYALLRAIEKVWISETGKVYTNHRFGYDDFKDKFVQSVIENIEKELAREE